MKRKMKNIKKKLINNIFKFMEIEEVQYGSRDITFGDIIKEILVAIIFWFGSIYFLVREEQIFVRVLLIWSAIFWPFEIIYFISGFLYLKKDKSDKNRNIKENFFYLCLVLFVIATFPYFFVSKVANALEFQNLFEYGYVFIFEILLLFFYI